MNQLIAELDGFAEDLARDGAAGVETVASASQQLARLERENTELRNEIARLNNQTNWVCKCGGTDCEGQRENAALRELTSTLGAPNHINIPVEKWRELREDKERLDWLEKARPIAWALESVNCGKYWLLTDIGEKHPEEAEEFATLRAAIDAARKEAQP